MKRKLLSILIIVIITLYGCAPSFAIKSLSDKFSDISKPEIIVGENNRISTKSSQGGWHVDEKGVYVDPYVSKDRITKEILSFGFYITHLNRELNDGFRPINQIIFITDSGKRIELSVTATDTDFSVNSWNNITNQYNTSFSESGHTSVTRDDFLNLVNAKWCEAKIVGGERIQTYDKDDISSDFLKNLKTFYNQVNNN